MWAWKGRRAATKRNEARMQAFPGALTGLGNHMVASDMAASVNWGSFVVGVLIWRPY